MLYPYYIIFMFWKAPDALGLVPAKPLEVEPSRVVPFRDLVVPKYYKIAGYNRVDVEEAMKNYVTPGLARPLRTGAEVNYLIV